jgi:hypothetical protein
MGYQNAALPLIALSEIIYSIKFKRLKAALAALSL